MVQCCLCRIGYAEVNLENRGESSSIIVPICVDCRAAMLHKEVKEDNE